MSKSRKTKQVFYWLSILGLCAAAAWMFFYTTPNGLGLTNDSSAYIGGARSLLAGQGYVRIGGDGLPRPITHFPPFYSIVLAAVSSVIKQDPLRTAKWVNLVCAVLNQALFLTALLSLTGSRLTAFLGGLTFLCAAPVLQANAYGLSETLYLTLFLIVFILSVRAVRNGSRWQWIVIGLLSSALALTRYAGLAAVVAVMVYLLCAQPTWKRRIGSVLLYLAAFCIPFGFWLAKSSEAGESPVNRVIMLHLPSASKVEEGIRNFAGFFLPEFGGIVEKPLKFWEYGIAAGLTVLLVWVILNGIRGMFHPSEELSHSAVYPPALHGAAYMVMLMVTVFYLDGSTLFDNRILLPFYICLLLLISAFCSRFLERKGWTRIAAAAVLLIFTALLFEDSLDLLKEYHRNGQGFAGSEWTESETRLAALELPKGKLLYCNRQTALSLLNDQPSYILPPMFDAASFSERESFKSEKAWMDEEVLSGNAYVIVFNYQAMMEDAGDREWLRLVLAGLPVLNEYRDGIIFGLK
ncbi:MAG: hypothetical protein II969_13350 [Anaerolineaceae bacterium]|nr:hypothetical protein [Anaerolineaceae bacterium]